jgi:RNA 3'-phosphate cyclase
MIEIDGSIGGGSVLRVATGLAIASEKAIRVVNIRQNRRKPGLQAQHRAGLRAAAKFCDGQLIGDEINSTQIEFTPGPTRREKLDLQIETAGSIALALQPIIIAALGTKQPVTIAINGGATFGQWAPPAPYFDRVLGPMLEPFGLKLSLHVDRHGFYPQGGSRVTCKLRPCEPAQIRIHERGKLLRIKGISIAANHLQEARVALRQAQAATNRLLAERLGVRVDIRPDYDDTRSPGSGIVLWAEFEQTLLGASALGALGKRSEIVGEEAADALLEELRGDGTVDTHLADQLIPVIALAGGAFRVPAMTEHVEVNLAIVRQLLGDRIRVENRWLRVEMVP